jgi:hypothetical protein
VNAHGASGSEVTTGNARLTRYVMERGRAAGIPVPALEGFERAMEQAMGGDVARAAQDAEAFARRNDAAAAADQMAARAPAAPPSPAPQDPAPPAPQNAPNAAQIEGFLMEQQERVQNALRQAVPSGEARSEQWDGLWIAGPMLGLLLVWRWRRRHAW